MARDKNIIIIKHYGRIVDRLFFRSEEVRTILIASAFHKEGRTTTAQGLAFASAILRPSKQILLVDADFRNPSLHCILSRKERPGLLDLIGGDVNEASDCYQRSELPNLTVMTAGGKSGDEVTGLFRGEAMMGCLQNAKERFDLAFYDSPPVREYLDALYLSRIVDTVLMVVRPKISRLDEVISARNDIHHAGGKVIGLIMNDFRNPIPSFLAKHL